MMESRMVKRFVKKHNYLAFSFFALALTSVLLILPKSAILSLKISILISMGFLGWSLIHHYYDKSLSLEVMLEYILTIALVILSVVYFLL